MIATDRAASIFNQHYMEALEYLEAIQAAIMAYNQSIITVHTIIREAKETDKDYWYDVRNKLDIINSKPP